MDDHHDFGTGLRAHLGLEQQLLELLDDAVELDDAVAPGEPEQVEEPEAGQAAFEALVVFEHELIERERELERRERALASRTGALLAAAQALHEEVTGTRTERDELARLRRRKSGAA